MPPIPKKCAFCPMLTLDSNRVCPLCQANPRRWQQIQDRLATKGNYTRKSAYTASTRHTPTPRPDGRKFHPLPSGVKIAPVNLSELPESSTLPEQLPCVGCNRQVKVTEEMAIIALRLRCLWSLCDDCKRAIGNYVEDDGDE